MAGERRRELHPGAAIVLALFGHAAFVALAFTNAPVTAAGPRPAATEVETEIEIGVVEPSPPSTAARTSAERAALASTPASRADPRAGSSQHAVEPAPAPASDPLLTSEAGKESVSVPPPSGPRRRVDLGLGGGLTRQLVLEDRRRPRADKPAGALGEGLTALDTARGRGRSSAAISAAHGAALRLAPDEGAAVFEVRADASGNVIAVTLVSFGSSESRWRQVADSMHANLKRRKLRVGKGAGLVTRLRVERGELAKQNSERGRTERGTAIGQDSLGVKDVRDESTRASLSAGRISPSLGVGVAGGGGGTPTRVVLLSERVL